MYVRAFVVHCGEEVMATIAISVAMGFSDRKGARTEVQRQLSGLFIHVQKVCVLRGGFLVHAS